MVLYRGHAVNIGKHNKIIGKTCYHTKLAHWLFLVAELRMKLSSKCQKQQYREVTPKVKYIL